MTSLLFRALRASPSSVLFGVLVGAAAIWTIDGRPSSAAPDAPRPIVRTDAVSRVARDRARSVVLLHTIARSGSVQEPLGWYLRPTIEALGSGIVIDPEGLILTNAHVIEGAAEIHVRRPDGEDVEVTLVGSDPESDLALVRVSDATGLEAAPLGDSDRIEVGSFVIAIGSPLGFHHTVTAGVLSAKARDLDNAGVEFLQTDAAVNAGSSGGPLLDLSGRVVGVITAIVSERGENIGLNFAIPINRVKDELPALRTNSVKHAWLGVQLAGLSSAGAEALGLGRPRDALVVTAVASTGPAARAGVRPADVLVGMAGDPPVRASEVQRRIRTMAPGTSVRLRILRDGENIDLPVVLGTRPPDH